ncbi:MAG TPA: glycine--tRNA ligase subunit beta [Firmicutes bacterium]|nr:glycine--tRNA ligase subunit beta [Bacillota bacterium]
MADLIFELGHEELPPSVIPEIKRYLEKHLESTLINNRLVYVSLTVMGTCRRTIVVIRGLPVKQDDLDKEVQGPAENVLYREGVPTPALSGFLKKYGASEKELRFTETGKGRYSVLKITEPGRKTGDIIRDSFPEIIKKIPLPKSMHWDGTDLYFIRPIRNLLVQWNGKVLDIKLGGLKPSDSFLPNPVKGSKKVKVRGADDYLNKLREFGVVPGASERKSLLHSRIQAIIPKGFQILSDEELSEEIVNITEDPYPVLGRFNDKYLNLPRNILVYTLKKHQRFFNIISSSGEIEPMFIGVADGERNDYSQIKKGFEEVLVARLEDAHFFYSEDLKINPEHRIEKLKELIFLENFGTMYDKTLRVQDLSLILKQRLNLDIDGDLLKRAAFFSRNDLLSNIILEKEYANLQGEMGSIYLNAFGESPEVAESAFEMYLPRFSGDFLPGSSFGKVLSIADRLDTISVFFSAGKTPTGSADPFALRRSSLGLILIILDSGFDFDLGEVLRSHIKNILTLFTSGEGALEQTAGELAAKAVDFIKERLRTYLTEEKGFNSEAVSAVFITEEGSVLRMVRKVEALDTLVKNPDFDKIKISFKRVMNIIEPDAGEVNKEHLKEEQERELYDYFLSKRELIEEQLSKGRFREVFDEFLNLRPYIDNFFDNVLVNCEDENLKKNRMAMLTEIGEAFLKIANFKMIS